RKHLAQAGVLAVVLALVGWALFQVNQGPLEASRLVGQLRSAATEEVPDISKKLSSPACWRWAEYQLRKMADTPDSKQRLHASLALLPKDPGQKDYLYGKLLEADPDELRVILYALAEQKHHQELIPRLWDLLVGSKPDTDPDRRLRAACALGYLAPRDPLWE